MSLVFAGILGGAIGGALVGCILFFWTAPGGSPHLLQRRREAGRLNSLSCGLWQLYVAMASGSLVSLAKLRRVHDEVLLATFGACDKETDEALRAMASLLQRAWKRQAEFRRVGLSVHPGQFSDLTADMQTAFARVQLASGWMRFHEEPRLWEGLSDLSAARLRRLAERRP
ncbi:MAG: hypothetical protein M1274_01740 [Actinobacteria bacterium]|nr:hypothetical protein [Actinomycetota bacterium]